MKKNIKNKIVALFLAAFVLTGCEFGDINEDPSRVTAAQLISS
jgi:hypothetical protein